MTSFFYYTFSHASLLHAICALASLYTPIVTDIDEVDLDVGKGAAVISAGVFQRRSPGPGNVFRSVDDDCEKPFNFATSHLRWSTAAGRKAVHRGEALIEQAQSK